MEYVPDIFWPANTGDLDLKLRSITISLLFFFPYILTQIVKTTNTKATTYENQYSFKPKGTFRDF